MHPTYYALLLNGIGSLMFGCTLLLMPKMMLRTAGYNRSLDAQLVMMHRITGCVSIRLRIARRFADFNPRRVARIWVMFAGSASTYLARTEDRVACGVFATAHIVEDNNSC